MTAGTWQQIREVFGAAMGLDAPERAAYLAGVPNEVRCEVESLIAAHGEAGQFLQTEVGAVPPGSRLGPYRILDKIGEGGMGAVYLARREDFEHQVALKIVSGVLATEEMDRRFLAERQTLARLSHPNIVRLLDGGEHDARRYFAMEFVTGVPITDYCRDLPLQPKLAMFRTVCGAIHYAHQHLIVHRDIKPPNILVTADGEVKVLDFGIAKLLDSSLNPGATTRLHPMSLDCASPEQVKGLPVSTATDVYSLGVLLYELLAGASPQGGAGRPLDETIRRICELPVERPSSVKPGLAQDLDSIVLRAMQKDPAQRYSSVEELSADVGRFLEGRPVIAREATFPYVARKFVARHKAAVAAAAGAVVLLLGGSGMVLWEARVAARERALAQRRFEETRKLARSVIFDLQAQLGALPGTLPVRRRMIEQTVSYLESMARDAGDNTELLVEIAGSYSRVGEIQGGVGSANLGDVEGAIRSWQSAIRLVDRALAKDRNNTPALEIGSGVYGRLGGLYNQIGKRAEASAHFELAAAMAKRFQAAAPGNPASSAVLGGALFARATSLEGQPRVEAFQETLAVYESILKKDAASLNNTRNVALSLKYLANALQQQGEIKRGLPYAIRARELDEVRLAATPADRSVLMDLSNDLGTIGNFHREMGNASEAVSTLRRNLEVRQRLASEDPGNALARERIAKAHQSLAFALLLAQDPRSAREEFQTSMAMYRGMLATTPDSHYALEAVVANQFGLAKAAKSLHDTTAACQLFVQAQQGIPRLYPNGPQSKEAEQMLRDIAEGVAACR
jgi:tetratricopeptide (TPR) repeat protein